MPGKVVQVEQLPKPPSEPFSAQRVLARFCYHYQQYTYAEARKIPYRRIRSMLNEVMKIEAQRYHTLTQIAAAPHTDKGKGVSELLSKFKDQATYGRQ